MSARKRMRRLLQGKEMILAAGAYDALSAKLIEKAGFGSIYTTGFGITGSLMGLPDAGFIDMTQNLSVTRHMVRNVEIPVLADIDTGYGSVASIPHTVREFEAIGAAGVILEDQVSPKRCPLLGSDLQVIPLAEAAAKIKVAVQVRLDPDFLIVGRTDCIGDEVYRRADAFAQAGADMVVPINRAFRTPDDCVRFLEKSPLPVCMNMSGWIAANFTAQQLEEAGCRYLNFPLAPIFAALAGMKGVLEQLILTRDYNAVEGRIYSLHDYEELVGAADLLEMEKRAIQAAASVLKEV